MHDELAARHRAITLRLAGRPTKAICAAVGRSEVWFRKWWGRYLEAGPEGLYDLTRANHHVAQRIPPELERAILSVRRRLQAHATPATRYCLIGATAILAELKGLGVRPLPCERTVERVLERNRVTAPRVRLASLLPRQEYPGPQATAEHLTEIEPRGRCRLPPTGRGVMWWRQKHLGDEMMRCRFAASLAPARFLRAQT
jgi:Homeodomain-like domain